MKGLGTTKGLTVILASSILVGCMGAAPTAAPRAPGLYGRAYYGYSGYGGGAGNFTANVGLPVDWGTYADCVGGSWSRDRIQIVSGALPPGLRIDPSSYHIVGAPTRAGTWHLRVKFMNIQCAGKYYKDNTQDLHITTKGSSAPRKID